MVIGGDTFVSLTLVFFGTVLGEGWWCLLRPERIIYYVQRRIREDWNCVICIYNFVGTYKY